MAEKKFFNKYPYTDFHEMNLDWIVNKTEECVDTVSEFDDRLTTAEGDISGLKTRMTTAEGDISGLKTRMTTAEGKIDTDERDIAGLRLDLNTAQDDISGLKTRMTTAEGDISGLKTRMTTAEGNITNLSNHDETTDRAVDALQTAMTTAQDDISGLKTRMTAAEGDIDALEAVTTRTGVPLEWTSTKGTPQGEIDLQKYGKIRILYLYGYVENLTAALSTLDLMMTAQLPSDSYPVEDVVLYVPVNKDSSPYVDNLKLRIDKTTGVISVYNDHESFGVGDDSQIIHYVLTYNVL